MDSSRRFSRGLRSKNEERLAAFFHTHGIEVSCGQEERPSLRNPNTGRRASSDFYIPAVRIHVEVKGVRTFPVLHDLYAIACREPRYYVYVADPWDWAPTRDDWPPELRETSAVTTIESRARSARDEYMTLHRSRATWAGRNIGHVLRYGVAFQRQELLALARNTDLAGAASQLTIARLKRYVERHVVDLWNAGFLKGWRRPAS